MNPLKVQDPRKWGDLLWLDSHRLPHSDVRWDLGTKPNGGMPTCYASVLPLTTQFNRSGTGLWLENESGLSLLKTVKENELAQGNMNPHVANRKHPELDVSPTRLAPPLRASFVP